MSESKNQFFANIIGIIEVCVGKYYFNATLFRSLNGYNLKNEITCIMLIGFLKNYAYSKSIKLK
ncbi:MULTISPECIES: hypothetical protein [unclassified Gillisia]|uniref:hypothetical protein n=1 Tax=unclassified Gillisia TaxID=2615025 RepID=UPI00055086D5|nr:MULTISPECIES: hypothetical protein [unclassified Gillisia]